MNDLVRLIAEAPLYRRTIVPSDYARPTCLICDADEAGKASKWFKSVANRRPEYVAGFEDGEAFLVGGATFDHVRDRTDLCFVVFGRRIRRKCILLALNGVRNAVFKDDQKYGGARTQYNFFERNKSKLLELYGLLGDDESRLTLASILRQRVAGDCGYLRMASYPEYAHPQVKARPGDVVVDGGAYDGATSLDFAAQVGASGSVYAFEPDRDNLGRIAETIAAGATPNHGTINVVEAALTRENGFVKLKSAESGSSAIDDSGDYIVRSMTLDSFFVEKPDVTCSLISLDVEGFEVPVLEGARDVLTKQRPMLQVSIYHTMTDLFDIPLMLNGWLKDYKFFLGHHNSYSTETDLYAVPVERLTAAHS